MRSLTIVAIALAVTSIQANFKLNGEFVTGFESGIFLKEEQDIFSDYGCQKPKLNGGMGNVN